MATYSTKMYKSDKKKPKENQNIQVFVRVRPQTQNEKLRCVPNVVECPSSKEVLVRDKSHPASMKAFTFDHVFDMTSRQIDVYRHVVNPLIDEVLAGYNCTVFAYGQTGTGKTYTMEGERSTDPLISWEDDPSCGIIPRTFIHLFDSLRQEDVEFTVRVSFLELYNEELIDLLAPLTDSTKLRIFEDASKKGSVIIQGLQEISVHNKDDVYNILMKGSERRRTASTLMNTASSRSHTVFSITVHIKENLMGGDELLKTGKLNLVDLAGSENIGRSGAVDKRAREAGNINQSLLTLGRVITALVERTPHVPYRESKLTRLLQDSLGGRTKTCFVATISSTTSNLEETLSTLDYAHRAKDITNRPEINEKLNKKELLKEYTEEIERLRRDLQATREKNGVFMDEGEYKRLTLKLASLESENSEKYAHIKALREEMEKIQELCSVLNMEVSEKNSELMRKTEILTETEECLERTRSILVSTKVEKQISEHLVSYHEDKEKKLTEQAHSIMRVADQSTADASLLHDKLARKRSVEEGNKSRGEQFHDKFRRNVNHMEGSLDQLISEHAAFCGNLRTTLGDLQEQKTSELTVISEQLTKQVKLFMDLLHNMEEKSADAMRNAQHWIQTHLGFIQSMGTSVEDFRTSVMELVEPPLQGILEQLRKAVMDVQGLSNEVNDKIRDKEYRLEVFSLETKDALNGIEESLSHYLAQRRQESERLTTSRQNMVEDFEAENRETLSQLRVIAEVVQKLEDRTQSMQQRVNQSGTELRDRLSHIDAVTENVVRETQLTTGSLKKKLKKFVAADKQTSEDLRATLREFVEKRTVAASHMEHLRDEALTGCWSALSSHEEQSQQYYQSTEEQLRDHSEMLKRYLQSEHEQTQTLATKVRETAEVQESHLESQKNSFRAFMQERQQELEEECFIVRERGLILSDELRKRQAEMGHFFSEYVEDLPTGDTPHRRDFIYPRKLIVSSPKEIVIKRFQAQMDSAKVLQSAFENGHMKEKEDIPELSQSTTSLPEILAEPFLDPVPQKQGLHKAASDFSIPLAVANSNSNSDDELENKENQDSVKLPKGRAVKMRLRESRIKTKFHSALIEKNNK